MSTRRLAFTLIELLVVVAIITMLIAILLPSLGKAQETARRSVCASQLKQIGTSTIAYAMGERNKLPPFRRHLSQAQHYKLVNRWELNYIFDSTDPVDPTTDYPKNSFNLAPLLERGIIGDPKMLYCPSPVADPLLDYDQHPEPWSSASPVSGATLIRVSYVYNPQIDPVNYTMTQRTFEDLSPAKALTTDYLDIASRITHAPGWNLMFGDTSVRFKQSGEVYDEVVAGGAGWTTFFDWLQRLERE